MNPAQKAQDAAQDALVAYHSLEARLQAANDQIKLIRQMANQAALKDRSKAHYDDNDVVIYCMNIMER